MGKTAMAALAAVLLLAAACDDAGQNTQAAGGGAAPPPPAVTVAAPRVEPLIEWDEFTGRFDAVEDVVVRARVTGYVQEIHFEDGQLVEKGQLLFTIDPRTYEADVAAANADLVSAQAAQRLATDNLNRSEKLVSGRTISESTLDQARQAKASADAAVQAARAALARAQLDVEFTEVRSPITGRISDARVDVGDLVIGDNNPTELTRVVTIDPMYFTFELSERDYLGYQRSRLTGDMAEARNGTVQVELQLSDEDEWTRAGAIDFVDNTVNRGTGTIRLRAVVPNGDGVITPGLFGRLRLPGSPVYDAILVPDSIILSDQSQKLVLAVNKDNVVEAVPVRLGPRELGMRIIRSGLTPEHRIIISGVQKARPGMTVTPQEGRIELPSESQGAGSDQ
ncbi:efflux RND transporter periplasmic adaptor subunit [Pacificispira sp.]|uniref:efflux RND transporter periplasmic adaptor subunit n=1 Tax=Pacificispira sp. TaxID=2888761 RepID=UPI003B522338